ncbi:copper chaperone PCu(A)C [Kineosporiaceae bacterium SCSIO 59966]|nr:copper chaperone PCu(A)C [Kineosporiaceae bacterium SCSIO 59966]
MRPTRTSTTGTARAPGRALAAGALLLLTACGSADGAPPYPAPAASTASTAAAGTASALTLTDGWVKAADEGMTGVFGTLVNASDADVHVVAADSDVAGRAELHEMVSADGGQMVMAEKEDGVVVPAGGQYVLAPGGDHLMLMDLTAPLLPGDDVVVTLEAADGSSVDVTVTARTFSGAEESYQGGDS